MGALKAMHCTEQDKHFLLISDVWQKLARVDLDIDDALNTRLKVVPALPARDIQVLLPSEHPDKKGLSSPEGQARMLHDLASIELQALELGLRTLIEFPEAPAGFREELGLVTRSEGVHLRLCLEALNDLGFPWGTWPVHVGLWAAVEKVDSLLDRILIVHRYLEGSGLDAGEALLRRLNGVHRTVAHPVVEQINREEVGHVEFGSRWYRLICQSEGIDPQIDFPNRLKILDERIPRRMEKISKGLRLQAGFTEDEISFLEGLRLSQQQRARSSRKGQDNAIFLPANGPTESPRHEPA